MNQGSCFPRRRPCGSGRFPCPAPDLRSIPRIGPSGFGRGQAFFPAGLEAGPGAYVYNTTGGRKKPGTLCFVTGAPESGTVGREGSRR